MKITKGRETTESITMKTTDDKSKKAYAFNWWNAKKDADVASQLVSTASFLKQNQESRFRNAALFARLYGNQNLFSFVGANMNKVDQVSGLPTDRPTFNLVASVVDTLVSKISQDRPTPVFLTDNGDYRERNLSKKLNKFILGEFYHAKVYEKAEFILRDACVEGTGCFKVYETDDHRVGVDRVILTELLTDPNESIYGDPRTLYQFKLIDRKVLEQGNQDSKEIIGKASKATVDNSKDASQSISDMVLVVEAWRLPSGKDAGDGRHVIACDAGLICDEEWKKPRFPFVFMHYAPRMLGFWSQGVSERLMGTQIDLNSLLWTISRAIKLTGVPRVFEEEGSKVTGSAHNNEVGTIVKYRGIKPSYEVAPCNAPELYAERDKLIQYGFQQEGISFLQATAQKPAGLNSGEALRNYDDISNDRYAALQRRYNNCFIDLAYLIVDQAMDIAEEQGSYSTVYPNKNGVKEIDLPKAAAIKDSFVIQCYDVSHLPKEPAGRLQKITEMIQAGMIDIREGRRLLNYPDLEQNEMLENASEERILQVLDNIIDTGKYEAPDPFMDLQLAEKLCVQYYNLYVGAKLEKSKAKKLRTFHSQIQAIKMAAQPPAQPPGLGAAGGGAQPPPQASPEPLPTSPLVPNGNAA